MTKEITQTRVEDAISSTNSFLNFERGASLDGDFAAHQALETARSNARHAEDALLSCPHPKFDGLYVPLGKHNGAAFNKIAAALPNYVVLVPSTLLGDKEASFYPAVVSEDGLKTGDIRMHVFTRPYRKAIRYATSLILSAAGQSEVRGVGDHDRIEDDGIEAEHFTSKLTAGVNMTVQAAWRSGKHINHTQRRQPNNSVTTEMFDQFFGTDIPQKTITITRQQVEKGNASLYWHEGVRDPQTGRPLSATKEKALVIAQSLAFEALREQKPKAIDTVKELIS